MKTKLLSVKFQRRGKKSVPALLLQKGVCWVQWGRHPIVVGLDTCHVLGLDGEALHLCVCVYVGKAASVQLFTGGWAGRAVVKGSC